jgi:hypothetical protein
MHCCTCLHDAKAHSLMYSRGLVSRVISGGNGSPGGPGGGVVVVIAGAVSVQGSGQILARGAAGGAWAHPRFCKQRRGGEP